MKPLDGTSFHCSNMESPPTKATGNDFCINWYISLTDSSLRNFHIIIMVWVTWGPFCCFLGEIWEGMGNFIINNGCDYFSILGLLHSNIIGRNTITVNQNLHQMWITMEKQERNKPLNYFIHILHSCLTANHYVLSYDLHEMKKNVTWIHQ